MGHIYLIGQSDTPNVFKIGCTKRDVGKRTKTLQTGNSEELYLARSFETDKPFKLEKMLHNHFSKQVYLNEWYSLSDDEKKLGRPSGFSVLNNRSPVCLEPKILFIINYPFD